MVEAPVDPHLELAEIHRRVVAAGGPALLFTSVKGSPFPVATNLFGSRKRLAIAFHNRPDRVVEELVSLLQKPSLGALWQNLTSLLKLGLRRKKRGPILEESEADLTTLPLLTSWPKDGGPFITLPLVYTEPPGGGPGNLGMYRIQRFDAHHTGLHFQIGKGGGFHYYEAEKQGEALPVTIFLGGPPALTLAAVAPLPEKVPELLFASLLLGRKLERIPYSPHPLIAECEFALIGESPPHERRPEGPFGDHYGYYSLEHDFPYFKCHKVLRRKGAIYPATVVGKPRQEDFAIGDYLQDLMSPLFPVVMPGVKRLWSYGETGFHSLSAAVVQERYWRESMASGFRILGEGQLSLTKFLLLTDQEVDLRDFRKTLTTVLERFNPATDLYIFGHLSFDTLDYAGPELNKGSKGVLLGMGEARRKLPEKITGPLPEGICEAIPFCPGCLVIEGDKESALHHFTDWPLLVLVDNAKKATKTVPSFLWTTFTRFEPAADIHAKVNGVHRHHLCYEGPILIDARMKPSYPEEVLCDPETAALVTRRWKEYFPGGMTMGDSESADVY